jgi:excisionase family DNA binding protein
MEDNESQRGTRDMSREDRRDADDLLTLDEVAALLKLPKSWIYERTRRKLIPHVKLGKYLRFPRAALSRWVHGDDGGELGAGQGKAGPSEPVPSPARRRGRPLRPLPQSRRP